MCKRILVFINYVVVSRIDSEVEKEMEVIESDVSEGEEEFLEAGNCGVLILFIDIEIKGLSGRNRKIEEDYSKF